MRRPALSVLSVLSILSVLPFKSSAADVVESINAGYNAYLGGRYSQAIENFKYLDMLGITHPDAVANMALLSGEGGDLPRAAAFWTKAALERDADGYVWTQRGWSELALDDPESAEKSFSGGIERARDSATQAEAGLGLGLARLADSRPGAAMAALKRARLMSSYVLSLLYEETATAAYALKDREKALNALRESVRLDPENLEALKELAHLEEKIGLDDSAWALENWILTLDPENPGALKRLKKLRASIVGDPSRRLPIRRIFRPLLDPSGAGSVPFGRGGPPLRVALFSGSADGLPQVATDFYFMSNVPFKLRAAAGGEVLTDAGQPLDQWELRFRPDIDVIEVRDQVGNIQYIARQPFRIVPEGGHGSILLKSGVFLKTYDIDPGDRELRGAIEVRPNPFGFTLVNVVGLEDYLGGVTGVALPAKSPAEAYKAAAVVARTRALWFKSQSKPNLEQADICDSSFCQKYLGVSGELLKASQAVKETLGSVLAENGRVAHAPWHENCGGRTESGESSGDPTLAALVSVWDSSAPSKSPKTPLELDRSIAGFPPRLSYDVASPLLPPVSSRWARLLDAKDLERRARKIKEIGRLKALKIAKRSRTGRVLELQVEGTAGSILLTGDREIGGFLSPGSLRSTLFTIRALGSKRRPERFLLRGAGTGSGLGLCRAGALGLASLGRDWRWILAHYFPKYKIENLNPPPKPSAKKPSRPRPPRRSLAKPVPRGRRLKFQLKGRAKKSK